MLRKKSTPAEPISELATETTKPTKTTVAKVPTKRTLKPKLESSKQSDLPNEDQHALSDEVLISFRTKQDKPVSVDEVVAPRRSSARPTRTVTKSEVPKEAKRDDSNWDEDLPVPLFREASGRPPVRTRTEGQQTREPKARPTVAKANERPTRKPVSKVTEPSDDATDEVMPRGRRERSDDDAVNSFDSIEFVPTETLEFDDLIVQMRTSREIDKEALARPVKTTRAATTKITPRAVAAVKAPERTIIPPRALIEIPPNAPQVVVRDGKPTLVRDGRVYPNFWFSAAWDDEARNQIVLDEIKQACEAGINIVSLRLDAITDSRHFTDLQNKSVELLKRLKAVNSDLQVVFSLDLVAPKGWEMDFPEGVFRNREGDLAEPSISDDKYWSFVETLLVDYTKALLKSENASMVLGIEFDRNSWIIDEKCCFDLSIASKKKFRDWVRDRYQDDIVLLRSSWFDGSVDFENIRIPDADKVNGQHRLVREERKERSFVDYFLFLSDQSVARIADIAYAIKDSSQGQFLVGVRYGLTLEMVHPGSGQLGLGKVLRTPEIDFLVSSPSYTDRQPGGSASFPVPIDSFALNGKLFVSLEDFKTSLANRPEPDQNNPVMRTPQALESVHLRGFGAGFAHYSGVCWSDLWGNGWLTSASVWQRAKMLRDLQIRSMAAPSTDPEVAVFIDERALGYLVATKTFSSLVQQVRESVLRAGVSVGFYLLSDLTHREKFPESKLYVFLNSWDIRPELRSAIKHRLHRDKKVLFWAYAAALFDSGRETLERAREVTGIALKPQPIFSKAGTTILDRRNPIAQAFSNGTIPSDHNLEPTYFAIPEDGQVLGEYTQTGLPSFVVRDIQSEEKGQSWTSVFLGEPTVNPALIRSLAQRAGAHVWSFNDDVIHVRAPFLTIHCRGEGQRTIALPGKWSAYNLQTKEWAVVDSTNLRFTSPDGATHTFLVGTTDDIRKILEADAKSLLKMTELPARESNVRIDVSNFDVPIMRLDEWSNEGDVEDSSIDSYYFKPQEVDDYEEDASLAPGTIQRTTGRRRQERRGRRKESFADQVDFDPTGEEKLKDKGEELNILFRKRD